MNSKLSLMRATHYKNTYFTGAELKTNLDWTLIVHLFLVVLVEVSGLEPLTSCLQSRRSTN